ncbi:MAG: hypothetical protein ACYDGM_11195 [Vulcanimicrobiaceae bacterium]
MDVAALSTGLAAASVSEGVSVGVLANVQTLDKIVAAKLFSSIGIGGSVDHLA